MGDGMTDRREVLRAVAGLSVAGAMPALAGCSGGSSAFAQPVVLPNIVFIMADDLGYADLGCYGQRAYATPRIDALAAGGVRLTQGYANSCVCSATRTALATGRYQYRVRGRAAGADQRHQPPLHAPARATRRSPRCCAAMAIARRWSASGTSAPRPRPAPTTTATTTSSATPAAAPATIRCRRTIRAPTRSCATAARRRGTAT